MVQFEKTRSVILSEGLAESKNLLNLFGMSLHGEGQEILRLRSVRLGRTSRSLS